MSGWRLGATIVLAGVLAAGGAPAQKRQDQRFAKRSGAQTALGRMSADFAALAARVNASVVKIVAIGYKPVEKSGQGGAVSIQRASGGSGVIIDPDGYIVTNAHVALGAQRLQVILSPQLDRSVDRKSILKPATRVVDAELVGVDIETDLALLRIPLKGLPALKFGDSDKLRPGQLVLAFGSPLGLQNSVTLGVVSSPARQLRPEDPMIYIQTDAPINPGNSGGPLVNTDGEVVGINTLIFSQSGGSEGIGFAAPSDIVVNVIGHIRKEGRMVRGEIGVLPQTIDPTLASALRLSRPYGVVLGDVYPGSPADRAGLRPGDVVLTLDGKPMENARQFIVNLYRPAIGDMVRLEILRGREKKTTAVQVVERPNDPTKLAALIASPGEKISRLGIFVYDLSPDIKRLLPELRKGLGVLVGSLTADAPVQGRSFRPGDIIYQVNGEPVVNTAELRAALEKLAPGAPVAVQIERGRRLRYVWFELP